MCAVNTSFATFHEINTSFPRTHYSISIFSIEFHGIDTWMLKRALQTLEIKSKAQIFEGPTPGDDNGLGVKFF